MSQDMALPERNFKKLFIGVFLAFMVVGFAGYQAIVFFWPPQRFEITEEDIEDLRVLFPEFIADRLKKEKKTSRLRDIVIRSVDRGESGQVNISYVVSFDETHDEEMSNSTIDATATLIAEGDTWKVTKVTSDKEEIEFTQGAIIKGPSVGVEK